MENLGSEWLWYVGAGLLVGILASGLLEWSWAHRRRGAGGEELPFGPSGSLPGAASQPGRELPSQAAPAPEEDESGP